MQRKIHYTEIVSIVTGENEKEEIQRVEESTLTTHSLQDKYKNENMPDRETAIAPILSPISQASTPCSNPLLFLVQTNRTPLLGSTLDCVRCNDKSYVKQYYVYSSKFCSQGSKNNNALEFLSPQNLSPHRGVSHYIFCGIRLGTARGVSHGIIQLNPSNTCVQIRFILAKIFEKLKLFQKYFRKSQKPRWVQFVEIKTWIEASQTVTLLNKKTCK